MADDEGKGIFEGDTDAYQAAQRGEAGKPGYKAPPKTFADPKTIQSAGAGAAGPQRKDYPAGLVGDAGYTKALAAYRRTVAKGQAMAISKDSGSGTP